MQEKLTDGPSDRYGGRHACIWANVENDIEGWQSSTSMAEEVSQEPL